MTVTQIFDYTMYNHMVITCIPPKIDQITSLLLPLILDILRDLMSINLFKIRGGRIVCSILFLLIMNVKYCCFTDYSDFFRFYFQKICKHNFIGKLVKN